MMENTRTPSIQDAFHLQQQFREKLYELQNNTDALRMTQKELLETRHALYSTKLQLEKERGVSHELRMQLKAVTDVVNKLEQQQTKDQIESTRLKAKYDTTSKQYDSLMNQATNTKVRETEYKMKIQNLEETLRQRETTIKRLEQILQDLKRDNLRAINTIDHNIVKLTQEQGYLTKSCDAIISLNQRLQTVGLCTHAIHQKDGVKINNLECMLVSQPRIENLASAKDDVY